MRTLTSYWCAKTSKACTSASSDIPIDGDPHAVAISSGVNTRAGSRRIAEFAFDYALKNGRKKITIVHKANVLKALTGIFLDTALEVSKK